MKKYFFIIIFSFLTCFVSISAKADSTNDNGLSQAYTLCGKHVYDSDKQTCLKIISSADYISEEVVNICAKMTTYAQINDCLSSTINKKFMSELLGVCTQHVYYNDFKSCINIIANKMAANEAIATCKKSTTYAQINSCLSIVVKDIPAPIPQPPTPIIPAPSKCDKSKVLADFDLAFQDLEANKYLSSYQKLIAIRNYLAECL